jgi:hypothetical protein
LWVGGGTTDRRAVASLLSHEADIAASPLTGIVTASVIAVVQRSTSTGGLTPLRERIARVAPLYKRLVVLVSEGGSAEDTLIGPGETAAIADLLAWASSAAPNASITLVPGGRPELARWAAAAMARAVAAGECGGAARFLIPAQTTWELFFRRAGLNTYAAQTAATAARGAYGEGGDGAAALAAFVCAPRREKKGVVGWVVGEAGMAAGRVLWEGVWAVVEAEWARAGGGSASSVVSSSRGGGGVAAGEGRGAHGVGPGAWSSSGTGAWGGGSGVNAMGARSSAGTSSTWTGKHGGSHSHDRAGGITTTTTGSSSSTYARAGMSASTGIMAGRATASSGTASAVFVTGRGSGTRVGARSAVDF